MVVAGDALIRTAVDGVVRTITLTSPQNRNALSRALLGQLHTALREADEDEDLRAVVVRADGPAFCAGADLKEAAVADAAVQAATSQRILAVLRAIVGLAVPVVAVVHAAVRAGGVGLVAACDFAVASTDATFALGEVRHGLAPAVISTVVVPRLRDRDATRLLIGAQTFDGEHATQIGLVTSAVPPDRLDGAVDHLVEQIVAAPRQALVATKGLLNAALLDRIDRDGPAMAELSARLFQSDIAQARFSDFLSIDITGRRSREV